LRIVGGGELELRIVGLVRFRGLRWFRRFSLFAAKTRLFRRNGNIAAGAPP